MADSENRRIETSGDNASGRDTQGSTLMPMLIAGLVLIVIGAAVVMMFV